MCLGLQAHSMRWILHRRQPTAQARDAIGTRGTQRKSCLGKRFRAPNAFAVLNFVASIACDEEAEAQARHYKRRCNRHTRHAAQRL